MLLSSKSDKIPKVEVPIAIKYQALEPHKLKADILDKSKPKLQPSIHGSPLLRLQLKPAFKSFGHFGSFLLIYKLKET